jgi:hypothetical protein
MSGTSDRQLFFKSNKYQRMIIHLVFYPSLVVFCIVTYYISMFTYDVMAAFAANDEASLTLIKWKTILLLAVITGCFLAIILWAYVVSSRLVGAFERILKELDGILAGEPKHLFKARRNDALANDLIQRLNALIAQIPDKRSKE